MSRSNKPFKVHGTIFIILIFGFLAASLSYPLVWNKGVNWLNDLAGTEIMPHFWERPFKLGLDLQGGTHFVYQADLTNIEFLQFEYEASGGQESFLSYENTEENF